MTYPPDSPRKIVRPRTPKPENRPLIAVSRDLVVVESMNDEVFPASELPTILRNHEPAIVVTQGFGTHLQHLQRVCGNDPQFNYRVTPIHRYARPWNDGRRVEQGMIIDAVCNYVGWKAEHKKDPNRYHYPLDPVWFLTAGIDDLDDSDRPRIVKLYEWAKQVRKWCADNNLTVKASAGGLAAALLKDPRFYPEPRRKAPRLINDIIRYRLPGNYYSLRGKEQHYYRALYLDMENAHHAMARNIDFPDVDTLHAYGHWAKDETNSDAPDSVTNSAFAPGAHPILRRSGIFHVRLSCPHVPRDNFPPPYMERSGTRNVFLYSNELELVESLGGKIEAIHAAYVSEETEPGLNKYAEWAIGQIRKYPDYKPWLKPTLHATYGLLAARPNKFETGFYRAKSGEPGEYHMGAASIPVLIKRRDREIESNIANVIHRGMIEAEVRKQALQFSRTLTADGHNVLAIYADAIFVEDTGRALRLLPPPWKLSKVVTSLRFHSSTHFTSPQFSRLPGVPRTARERMIRAREQAHARYWHPKPLPPEVVAAQRERAAEWHEFATNGVRVRPRSVRATR